MFCKLCVWVNRQTQEDGQSLMEYALVILFISIALVTALSSFASTLTDLYDQVAASFGI
jgi:Flp pilus assembly pilin Flp